MAQQAGAPGNGVRRRPARLAGAAVALLAAIVLVPLVRVLPGDGAAALALDAYLPAHPGEVLSYSVSGSLRGGVDVRLASRGEVAGVPTLALERTGGSAPAEALPFGLGGATVRIEGDEVVRTAAGGTVRDLLGPVAPGRTWSDTRHTAAGGGPGGAFTVVEERTLLGPASLDEPAGHLDRCLVVAVLSRATSVAGPVATAAATLWYCEGVGLARAVLHGGGAGDTVDLVGVRGG